MIDQATIARARTVYEILARRCAELGLPLWHCDPSGAIVVEPDRPESQMGWLRSERVRGLIESAAATLCAAEKPAPIEAAPGYWVIPIEDRQRVRRLAMNLALVLTDVAADAPSEAARHAPSEVNRIVTVLRWTLSDIIQLERDGRTLDQFSEKLAQAYEETNLLYRIARLLNSVDDPTLSIGAIGSQIQQVMPFGWLAIRFSERSHGVSDLAGKMLLAGQPPCDEKTIRMLSDPLLDSQRNDDLTKILNPKRDELAAAVGAEVLVEPIRHDDRVIGILLAGNKHGPDPELSSFETQFLDATADFLGVFHENLARFAEQQEMFLGTLRALTASIDAKDRYTRGHSERVGLMASTMAAALGLDKHLVEQYRIAGIVHDVGKIGVPEAVLTKPGRLTDEEFAQIKLHPGIGHHILKDIPALGPVLPGVLSHHERWDGRGYPNGIAGEDIPLIARVLALADTFDAMSSTRSYRPALPRKKVLDEIQRCAGTQFDPQLVPLFVELDFEAFDRALESHKLMEQEQRAA